MYKLLFFIDDLGSGGAQRQMAELAYGFRERGIEVCFLIYRNTVFYNELKQSFHVEIIEENNYLKRFRKLRRYIRSGNFDTVLSFLPSPNMISCLAGMPRHKWKIVVGERSANPAMERNTKQKLKIRSYALADFITSNSHANLQIVSRVIPGFDRKRMKVIYNIVDFSRFHPAIPSAEHSGTGTKIVIASRHHRLKNLDGLIEAVKLLPDNVSKELRIEWFGDRGSDDSLEQGQKKISDYGMERIFGFYPPSKEIHKIMADADAIGLFSFYEGLPNAVCEGMAMGKAVIASAVSDVPMLISEKKLLCDPTDPASISAALQHLLSLNHTERERIGNENYRKALELFDRNNILNQYLELFRS